MTVFYPQMKSELDDYIARLNIHMDNGQFIYENRTLTHNLQQAQPRKPVQDLQSTAQVAHLLPVSLLSLAPIQEAKQ